MKAEPCRSILAAGLLAGGIACAQVPTSPSPPPAIAPVATPALPVAASVRTHIMLTPDAVAWGACPPALPPGAQCAVIEGDPKTPNALFALRLKAPDDYRVPPHFHPADEHVVVVSGTLNMGLGDTLDKSTSHALPAGGFMVMPAGEHHYAWTKGETVIQIYAIGPWGLTYINPADDPRNR